MAFQIKYLLTFCMCSWVSLSHSLEDVTLVEFDGKDPKTNFEWTAENDPVMGGRSTSTFTQENSIGVWNGTVAIVPSLNAPGFCFPHTVGVLKKFQDASKHSHLGLRVRTSTPDYKGFKVSFAADTFNPQFKSFKADFTIPGKGDQCSSTEYCCPDAKHCLTPTNISCAKDANACSADQTCCPLTKICVNVGKPCESPCKESDTYCCPDAKACLKPTNPGVFCKDGSDCGSSEVCCPLTKLCVKPYEKCSPGLDMSVSAPSWTNTCKQGTTQDQLRWNVSKASADGGLPFAPGLPAGEKVTDAICCDTDFKPYAEPNGFFAQPNVNLFSKLDKNGVTTFYDSSCGIPIFKAPVGRSFEAFYNDTLEHGWPSFRTGEVVKENVVTVYSTGEVISKCGTHLGSYLPDSIGSRWCIDLMCISGQKK